MPAVHPTPVTADEGRAVSILSLAQTLTLGWYVVRIGLSMAQFLCRLLLLCLLLLRLAV